MTFSLYHKIILHLLPSQKLHAHFKTPIMSSHFDAIFSVLYTDKFNVLKTIILVRRIETN